MPDFSTVEDTLFVPMLGRIYCSENFPNLLNDKKALELKDKLPKNLKGQDTQTQYTLMASACRSINFDKYIKDFVKKNPNGVIVELGCGLETTFYRVANKNDWYEVDLDSVIEYRKEILGQEENEHLISCSAFDEAWMKEVRKDHPTEPILVTASGLFYYFEEEVVMKMFKTLANYGDIEVVFDTVNSKGMKRMSKYMKQVGHSDAKMYHYVDDLREVAKQIPHASVITENAYYEGIARKGLKFMTRASMNVSDKFMMVKMEHLKIN